MSIWALSDLHLSLGVPEKTMEVFGEDWHNYIGRIEHNWNQLVKDDDLVLIPGDISWANSLETALIDLKFIDSLKGTKLILKGNHDYWWPSSSKLTNALPKSIHFIHNNVFNWNDEVSIGGSRLWDSTEYSFSDYIILKDNPRAKALVDTVEANEQNEKIFERELQRLKLSLEGLNPKAKVKIALTHYPPIGADLVPSRASKILEDKNIDFCIFGHLHSIKKSSLPFGEARGVKYIFASCDYLNCTPMKVL